MSSLFDKLNLRPQERRLVVVVGIVVFVVLNFWLVIPMFGEYGRNEQRIKDVRAKLKTYQEEIGKKAAYEKERLELESQGSFVPTEEAALRMTEEIRSQEALTGVKINSMTQMQRQGTGGKTNAFFDEAAVTVNLVNSGEKELVEFLWRLADKSTLIRAKSMTLRPDPSRMRLQGPITLVKSFQRRPPPKIAAAAAKSAATAKTNAADVPQPAPTRPAPAPASVTPSTGPKPPTHSTGSGQVATPPSNPSGVPAPIPAPTPAGGTNRSRRSLPTPAKP